MQYAGIIRNDIAGGEGVCVSFFVQGCPLHCKDCHNPQTWSFDGGKEFTQDTLSSLLNDLQANGIQRNLNIMGGEPLCQENLFLTNLIILTVRDKYPDIKIYLWTGYTYEELESRPEPKLENILNSIDYLIDGPFISAQRDITLPLRGSRNQRILNMREIRQHGK